MRLIACKESEHRSTNDDVEMSTFKKRHKLALIAFTGAVLCAALPEALAEPSADFKAAEKAAYAYESEQSAARYEAVIGELEIERGVYDPRLAEELLGLAYAYRAQARHRDAVRAFERALHITRVNAGLHTSLQRPILEKIIEEHTALGDWKSLDRDYRYLYWVTRRQVGENDPKLLPVIDRVGLWHLKAYTEALDKTPFRHLTEAEHLYDKAVGIIKTHYGADDPRLINRLYAIAITDYRMASDTEGPAAENYSKGGQALQRLVDVFKANPELPPDSHANALTRLGDWYLLFNRHDSAMESYKEALRILQKNGADPKQIEGLFGYPQRLPVTQSPFDERKVATDKESEYPGRFEKGAPYAVASFDVTASGKAENIEIVESAPTDSPWLRRRVRQMIAASRFRPRFMDGEPVETKGVNLRYVLQE